MSFHLLAGGEAAWETACFAHAVPDKLFSLPGEIQSNAHLKLGSVVAACVPGGKLQFMTNRHVLCFSASIKLPLIRDGLLFH